MSILTLNPNPKFPFKVKMHVPGKGEVLVEFEGLHFEKPEFTSLLSNAQDDDDFVRKIVAGWNRKHLDAEFSPENLEEVLRKYPGCSTRIATAYIAELTGNKSLGN